MTVESRFNTELAMREAVFFDGPNSQARYSRFWLLLVLAAVIASAGVVVDSTATVIGAMIVAPLMTPILGTMLATVLGDRANLIRSLLLVLAGAAAAIGIGFLVGSLVVTDVLADTNSQVAGRVSPGLIDLLAALGTGVVGSVALVRKDISDTLPGVAIAISLVPPLAVVGLTLESGSVAQALGALLLFLTNVVAIIGTGIVVMSFYGVNKLSRTDAAGEKQSLRRPAILISFMVLVIGIPLAISSIGVASRAVAESRVHTVADTWAEDAGWSIITVTSLGGEVLVRAEGPLPLPETGPLTAALDEAGVVTDTVTVELIPLYSIELDEQPMDPLEEARALARDRRWHSIVRLLPAVIRDQPDNSEALCLMAESHYWLGDYQAALGFVERAAAVDVGPAPQLLLIRILSKLGRTVDAESAAVSLVRTYPGDAVVARAYVRALAHTDVPDGRLLEEARRAIALAAEDPDSFVMLGDVLAAMGQHRRAAAAYQQALGIDPTSRDAHYGIAATDLRRGRLGEVVRRLSQQTELDGDDVDARVLMRSAAVALVGRIQVVLWPLLVVLAILVAIAGDGPTGLVPFQSVIVVVAALAVIAWLVTRFRSAAGRWFGPLVRHIAQADRLLVIITALTALAGAFLLTAAATSGGVFINVAVALLGTAGLLTLARLTLR